MAKDKKKKDRGICEVKTFVDIENRRVQEFIPASDEHKPFYRGLAMAMMKLSDPRIPPQQIPVEFEYPEGTTLEKAFEKYDKMTETEIQRIQVEQQALARDRAKQVVPSSGVSIIGTDGKPLKGKSG